MSTSMSSIERGSGGAHNRIANITRQGVGKLGGALAIIAGVTATSAIQACGPADGKPECLTADCRDKQPGAGADAGGETVSEAGTGGGTDAVSAETRATDIGSEDGVAAGDADAEVAAKTVALKCTPLAGSTMSPAYFSIPGKPTDNYKPGDVVKDSLRARIALKTSGPLSCENSAKTGVQVSHVNCGSVPIDTCTFYAAGGATFSGKTLCKEGAVTAAVLSADDCPKGVLKSGEAAVLVAESAVTK